MGRLSLIIALWILALPVRAASLFGSNEVVVFHGDSIAAAHWWTSYIACYYKLMYPSNPPAFLGDQAAGGAYITTHPYEYLLPLFAFPAPASPTNVFFGEFTLNGAANSNTFFVDYTNKIYQGITSNNVKAVVIGLTMDDAGSLSTTRRDRSAALPVMAAQHGYLAGVDVHVPQTNLFWTNYHAGNGSVWGWQTSDSPGSGHPGAAGHLAFAYYALVGLGAESNVFSAMLDWSSGRETATNYVTVSNVVKTASSLSFVLRPFRMPFIWDDSTHVTSLGASCDATPAFSVAPWIDGIGKAILQMSNHPAGNYSVSWGGRTPMLGGTNVVITSLQISNGVNFCRWTNIAFHDHRKEVLGLYRDLLWVTRTNPAVALGTPRHAFGKYDSAVFNEYSNNGLRGQALYDALQDEVAEITATNALINAMAIPTNHTITLTLIESSLPATSVQVSGNVLFSGNGRVQ